MMSEFLHDVHCLHSRVSSHQSCSHWTRMILKLVIFLSALLCNISCQYSDHCALMMPGTWFWIRSFSSIKTIDNFTFLMTLHRSFPSGRNWRNGVRWFQQRYFSLVSLTKISTPHLLTQETASLTISIEVYGLSVDCRCRYHLFDCCFVNESF